MAEYSTVKMDAPKETFSTGATREDKTGRGRYDLISWHAMRREAIRLELGAHLHGDRNWEMGLPSHKYANGVLRHMFQHLAGDRSEDHLAAIRWNAGGLIHNEEEIAAGRMDPSLGDLPPAFNLLTQETSDASGG